MLGFIVPVWSAIKGAFKWLGEPGSWKAILVACALAAVAYGTFGYIGARREVARLSEANIELSEANKKLSAAAIANAKAIKSRNEIIDVIANKEAVGRDETIKAIQNNPDWANQPIPADVLDSLRR